MRIEIDLQADRQSSKLALHRLISGEKLVTVHPDDIQQLQGNAIVLIAILDVFIESSSDPEEKQRLGFSKTLYMDALAQLHTIANS